MHFISVSTAVLGLAVGSAMANAPISKILRRSAQGDAFIPGSTTGQGATCADAFGAGYISCGSGIECYNPDAGQSCCADQGGYPCPADSFCLVQGYCCPAGEDPATCAINNGVTLPSDFNTAPLPSATPAPSASSYSNSSMTTSVVYTTTLLTVTSCAATVVSCPASSTVVITSTIAAYTTVCPVTAVPVTTIPVSVTTLPAPVTTVPVVTVPVITTTPVAPVTTKAPVFTSVGTASAFTSVKSATVSSPIVQFTGAAAQNVIGGAAMVAGAVGAIAQLL
ncbi:MAG: hypothetical protein M1824_002644 [Vezdaea acicularis]|nr:MAG: hypothetical protein M1824_002644 [Vezdaea acicularis]